MDKNDILLEVENLKTSFYIGKREAKAVDDVSFSVKKSEVLGIVGESGSGKSVTSLSILRLIPEPPGKIKEGRVLFRDEDILQLDWDKVRKIRGNDISMIFQEPMTSLNPVFTIGDQIAEPVMLHKGLSKRDAKERAIELLEMVGIPLALKRYDDYPHQFSGGMRQRAMIAMALACDPLLLIADEPTTALDVTIQSQILNLMTDIKNKRKEAGIILITHDLAVVAETCTRVIVMYCGKIQEVADTIELFDNPHHPYTQGLIKSIPSLDRKEKRLYTIPGNVPSIFELPAGCTFCTRCDRKKAECETVVPELKEVSPGHFVRCHLY